MAKLLDLTGQRYGRLTAERLILEKRSWLCRCDCGKITTVSTSHLRAGHTQSCGCLLQERQAQGNKKHGYCVDRTVRHEYYSWNNAKRRCHDPKHHQYPDYGGRGITMYRPWRESFAAFIEYIGPCEKGMTIERIENDKGYEPDNVKWATRSEQAYNRRKKSNLKLFDGKTINEWSRETGIPYATLYYRIHQGWPIKDALTVAPHSGRNQYA